MTGSLRSALVPAARSLVRRFGVDLVRYRPVPVDLTPEDQRLVDLVRPYTMISADQIAALRSTVRWITEAGVPGAVVECGVWRGGSMMAIARVLMDCGDTSRDLYLFDTFEGMPEPTDVDRDFSGRPASKLFSRTRTGANSSDWCRADVAEVRANLLSSGYPREKIHLVQGLVEETVPERAPTGIALLRLDTDWYSSTAHELEHLWPRLAVGGVCIVDDYGHWAGARAAVDGYFAKLPPILLHRLDYTGRLIVKDAGTVVGRADAGARALPVA